MLPISISGDNLVEMRRGKKIFLQSENFLLMHYNTIYRDKVLFISCPHK